MKILTDNLGMIAVEESELNKIEGLSQAIKDFEPAFEDASDLGEQIHYSSTFTEWIDNQGLKSDENVSDFYLKLRAVNYILIKKF